MNDEFAETVARLTNSIMRVPDRLSNSKGEAARSEYVSIFGKCIFGHEHKEGGLYLTLPFQTALLTDPILYIVAGGLLVLDHPTKSQRFEFALNDSHVVDLNPKSSLYENRYPRIIACPRKREKIKVSFMINRLMEFNFSGPFSNEVTKS